MGAVPVLLMVTLFGTLSAQPYHEVCGFQTVNVPRLSDARLPAPKYLGDRLQEREVLLVQAFGHEVAVYHPVSDATVIGDTTVRETARAANANASQLQQTDDSSPVAIPELVSDSAGCNLNAARNSRVIAVWKPDNSGVAGSGFSFPSVPPSLAEAGQTFTQNVDRAGRPIDPAASALGATNGTTLPSTTVADAPSFPVPPFTSSAGVAPTGSAAAIIAPTATQVDPPVSTRSAATRTTNWGQFPLPTTAPAASVSTPSAFGATAASAANVAEAGIPSSEIGSPGASPLLPTDTFGRTPNGLTAATAGRPTQPAYSNLQRSTTSPVTSGFVHVPTTASTLGRNQTGNTSVTTSFGAGSATLNPARETKPAKNLSSGRPTSSGQAVTGLPVGRPPVGRFGVNPSASFSQTAPVAYPATGTGFSAARPDARLSAAQLAAGAWSVDAFGQPVDRTGQLIASAPAINHGQRRNEPTHATGSAGFSHPFANQTATDMTNVRSDAVGGNVVARGSMAVQNEAESKFNRPTGNGKSNQFDTASLAPSTNGAPIISETQVIETESVTTQPLFNGLLLISIVANVYLIFWLKNLRLQYHEMVTAKRMASSNTPSN